ATVMDLFSRRIIGWEMSHRMTKELTITALKRAINQQLPNEGLIIILIEAANTPQLIIKQFYKTIKSPRV
ncbi:DDE-type integrase/transposase/recombinase, partial [Virgibacillus halophilus]